MREYVEKQQPELPAGTHPDVVQECQDAWGRSRPWTVVRELRKGVDDPSGHSCLGSQGKYVNDGVCPNKVEGVNYNVQGYPQFYCEEHALLQSEWEKVLYDSVGIPPRPKRTAEDEEWLRKFMEKGKKRKKTEEIVEDDDLMS